MVTRDRIRTHFLELPKTIKNIIAFCQEEYENIARERGDLYVTNYLDKLVRQVCTTLHLSNAFRTKVLNGLYHVTLAYRVRAGMECNRAPIFHPSKHFALIEKLWSRNQPSVDITFACKTTAVQALICLYTFRRWVDPTRIRWEHCDRVVNQGRIFLKFKLSASKSNRRGQRNEYITLQQNNLDLCPIRILNEYWRIQGCPRTGFVLPCLHDKRTYEVNGLCDQWNAYTCSGHTKDTSGKVPCLGEANGKTTFGFYKRAAIDSGWQTLPHSHSFRRSGIVIANKLEIPRDRITEFFGWKSNSEMPSHYVQEELALTNQGIAWRFSDALTDKLSCLADVTFNE